LDGDTPVQEQVEEKAVVVELESTDDEETGVAELESTDAEEEDAVYST
jgi:hypothetical protein